jgi:hypothetical protein
MSIRRQFTIFGILGIQIHHLATLHNTRPESHRPDQSVPRLLVAGDAVGAPEVVVQPVDAGRFTAGEGKGGPGADFINSLRPLFTDKTLKCYKYWV